MPTDSPNLAGAPALASKNQSVEILTICISSLAILVALVAGVGIPNHMVLRHIVQTLPFWVPVLLSLSKPRLVAWTALPLLVFWFFVMSLIWTFLLGISHVLSGHFSDWEIAMTIVVGIACVVGFVAAVRLPSTVSIGVKILLFILLGAIQFVCFRVSFLPMIAHR